jgi:uncharacterized LabA/DUF88 family protein
MDRVAVLVDAGYFFAAGSALISGHGNQRRETMILDERAAVLAFEALATKIARSAQLLRIYWYDGASRKTGPTAEHTRLAHCDNIKVRLGFLNAQGQQKGVDSLIVTDLVELARNRAVGDVLLLSGDEDVRIGVQLAQNFGVRIHLVGIKPCGGNQSAELRQEADTCTELEHADINGVLSMRPLVTIPSAGIDTSTSKRATVAISAPVAPVAPTPTLPTPEPASMTGPSSTTVERQIDTATFQEIIDAALSAMTPSEIGGAVVYMSENGNNVPYEIDSKILARCKAGSGQYLDEHARKQVRRYLRARLKDLAPK